MVMYGGRVMEQCSAENLFARPSHPYTIGLLRALPRLDQNGAALQGIPGNPPNMAHPPSGCPFQERCVDANARCGERALRRTRARARTVARRSSLAARVLSAR
jgi:oligopeptide transport system ATP-binding protein